MTVSTLSPKFQIVIPKEVRQSLGLKSGQRLQVIAKGDHVELRPILTPEQLIGFLKGSKPLEFERDGDRDL